MSYVEYASMNDLRDDAYKHLHKLPIGYFKKEKVGNLISRFTNDVNRIQDSISATFSNLIKEPSNYSLSDHCNKYKLATNSFFSHNSTAFDAGHFVDRIKGKKAEFNCSEKNGRYHKCFTITISGVKVVKAFGMEDYENKKFLSETRSFSKEVVRIVIIRNATSPLTEMISILVGAIIIYYGGTLVLQSSTLTASLFMGFLLAILQMMRPIKNSIL